MRSNELLLTIRTWMLSLGQLSRKAECLIVYNGLLWFALLYYTRNDVAVIIGIALVTMVGIYWGYSITTVHPMSLQDFRLITKRWQLYGCLGIAAAFLGWGYEHVVSKWMTGQWLPMNYQAPWALVVSITTVVIAEELFFNGYLLTRLHSFTANKWLRYFLVVAAMGFYKVCIHIWDGHPIEFYISLLVNEIFLSYLTTWWADYTGSIVPSFAAHLVWDLLMYGTMAGIPHWVF